MASIYDGFTNKYPVSKTLRFELIPQRETLEYLEKNGILNNDEQRSEDYKKLKLLLDEYYKAYIEDALSDVELEGLDEYARLYSINNRTPEEKTEFSRIQEMLRKQIVAFLTADEKYKSLFKKEIIDRELIEFLEGREEDLRIAESFKGFSTMCTGFWENRRNVFSDEEKSTAIAYRVVHDNLPKFLNNMKIFHNQIAGVVEVSKELLDKADVSTLDDIFSLEYFSRTLSQSGIETYNCILGGFSANEKTKVQGINELINLYNQQKPDKKIASLQPLFKQILSDRTSLSFIAEAFEDDNSVIETVKTLYDCFEESILRDTDSMFSLAKSIGEYRKDGIYIKNDKAVTDFSNEVFGEWNHIISCFNEWYDNEGIGRKKTEEKYIDERKSYFKKYDSFSLSFIEKTAGDNTVADRVSDLFEEKKTAVIDAYKSAEALLGSKYSPDKNLIADGDSVAKLKNLLDAMKAMEGFIRLFAGTGHEPDRDELFYGEFTRHAEVLNQLDSVYNKTRNYVTKKPYKTEKIKLTFDSPTLLDGWDLNKERDNKAVILRKDGYFYLGIMNKKDNKVFLDLPDADGDCFEKMEYKLLPGPNKMLPKVFFAKSNIDYYAPGEELLEKYKEGTHKKGADFNIGDCHNLIDFFKESIEKHPDWSKFGFEFSDTKDYEDISGFYKEVSDQGYMISFKNISTEYIDELVRDGKLYLFKIYNKDFSPYSKGRPNLHTMYWKALFDNKNMKNLVYKLNGQAEVFYRRKSIPDDKRIIHTAGVPIDNRNGLSDKKQSVFDYEIIKDKRYTVDKFQFHVPITMNYTADGRSRINSEIRKAIKDADDMHIIGIDRGERHLLYVTVIDLNGNIKEQYSLNEIVNEYRKQTYKTDYRGLLDKREKERLDARQQWKSIESIKELKDGYMSQVVHIISQLMIKYNAIVVMEDLNSGFKRGRQKVEKQVYQKFEKALIDKLNYLVDKTADEDEITGIYKALQLTEEFDSFKKLGRQSGAIFYVNAWNTSKMDPTTGFVNLLNVRYESVAKSKVFIEKFKEIRFCDDDKYGRYLTFSFDYNDFTEKAEGTRTGWTVCSYGTRIVSSRNSEGYWEDREIILTDEFESLFDRFEINDEGDIKSKIIAQDSVEFFKSFMWLLRMTLQIRNSETNGQTDYMISPVKNTDGIFFNTNDVRDGSLPENADANGAYNIARKGLWIVEQLKSLPDDRLDKANIAVSNKDWLRFAQR